MSESSNFQQGIDYKDFIFPISFSKQNHYLYYGDGKRTDKAFIKNVYIFDSKAWTNKGEHWIWVYGPVQKGDYIMTSCLYGIGIKIDSKEVAFAQAIGTNLETGVHKINVEFL